MKLNKIMKVIVAILLISLVTVFVSQAVMAKNEYDPTKEELSSFTNVKDNSGLSLAAKNIIGMIINVAQIIGTGVAIIMLIVLAIKYISASPEGKAEIKKNATIYIVGAVILFAASGILGIIRRFAVLGVGGQNATDGITDQPGA